MQRSDLNTAEERIAYDNGFATASRMYRAEAKARYDRFVCAVASAYYSANDLDNVPSQRAMATEAMMLMLAADKRWEEYVKGGTDETH